MRCVNLILILMMSLNGYSQKYTDLSISIADPTHNQQFSINDPLIPVKVYVYNNGPDTIVWADAMKLKFFWNNNVVLFGTDSFIHYGANKLNPGDSAVCVSQNMNNTFSGNNSFCFELFLDSASPNIALDTNTTNNKDCVTISVGTTKISETNNNKNIRIFPNPATDFIYWESDLSKNLKFIIIYNVFGKEVFKYPVNSNSNKIEVSSYPAGLYYLQFIDNNNYPSTKSFIIR